MFHRAWKQGENIRLLQESFRQRCHPAWRQLPVVDTPAGSCTMRQSSREGVKERRKHMRVRR